MANARVVVTGMGVVSSIGHDVDSFAMALHRGDCGIGLISPGPVAEGPSRVAAEIRDFSWPEALGRLDGLDPAVRSRARKVLNNAPGSTRLSAAAAAEAFHSARLYEGGASPEEIGLIVAGNNISQGYIAQAWKQYLREPDYINPKFALSFFDTNQVGCLSEILGIRGPGFTVGGASASGNLAVINARLWIESGAARCLLVCGACADFSELEMHGFRLLGASSGADARGDPHAVYRPFDRESDGFVIGQASACLVLESAESAKARSVEVLAEIVGGSIVLDASHLAHPSEAGEARAMTEAIARAGITASDIQYVNAHGSGSPLGDRCECEALRRVFGDEGGPRVNSTKSLVGHCMFAAGVVELVAVIVQIRAGFLHPNLNLDDPIDPRRRFVGGLAEPAEVDHALSNSFAFGGINSSIVLGRWRPDADPDRPVGSIFRGG